MNRGVGASGTGRGSCHEDPDTPGLPPRLGGDPGRAAGRGLHGTGGCDARCLPAAILQGGVPAHGF